MCGERLRKEVLHVGWVFNETGHAGDGLDLNEGPKLER